MRTSSLAALVLVTGCSGPGAPAGDAPAQAEGGEHIACALAGATVFADTCAVERTAVEGERILVVRHPDGGFRRFAVTDDGRGVAPADGAQGATLGLSGNVLEVTVGADRYRFPVTVKDDAAKR